MQDLTSLLSRYKRLIDDKKERIEDSSRRIFAAFHFEPLDRPPVIQVTQTVLFPREEIFSAKEKLLLAQLANIVLTLQHETDYMPFIDSFEGVTVLAEAFGCEVIVPSHGDPQVSRPLIFENYWDVWNLQKPDAHNPVYLRILEHLHFFEEMTDYALPVTVTDPQSPLDVASLIWDNTSFLLALRERPKEVHHLLHMVTEAFIEFYSLQYGLLKNPALPGHSFPLLKGARGISISDDEAVLLSPQLFEEFNLPYLAKISETFGGLYYHCCGDFGHLIESILKIPGLRAVNAHLSPREFHPEYVRTFLDAGVALFLGMGDVEVGWKDTVWEERTPLEIYDEYYLPEVIRTSKGRGITLTGYGGYRGFIDLPGLEHGFLTDSSGHGFSESTSCFLNLDVRQKNALFSRICERIQRLLRDIEKCG